jgi:hypothetical protein
LFAHGTLGVADAVPAARVIEEVLEAFTMEHMVAVAFEPNDLVSILVLHEAKAAARLRALVIKLLILRPRNLFGFLELV